MNWVTAKSLREKRAPLGKQIKDFAEKVNAESRDFTPEENEQWKRLNGEYDGLTKEIEKAERFDAIDLLTKAEQPPAVTNQTPGREDVDTRENKRPEQAEKRQQVQQMKLDRDTAYGSWFRHQAGMELRQEEVEACQRIGFNPGNRELSFQPLDSRQLRIWREQRAQSSILDTTGGYLVIPTFMQEWEKALLAFGGPRSVAEVIRTAGGEDIIWPMTDDTGNVGRQLSENVTASTTAQITVKQFKLAAHKYTSDVVLVPFELLRDSSFDVPGNLGALLGERIGRITSTRFTTGIGGTQPQGIVTGSTLGKTTASATAIAFDELYDLVHAIDSAYRTMGCGFMMHDNIVLYVRKLKDGEGRYLWQDSTQVGVPATLAGYPVTINQDMQSSVATATKTMLFGLLSAFKIRDAGAIRVVRFNELYAAADQVGFTVFSAHDSGVKNAGTNPIKHMLQA